MKKDDKFSLLGILISISTFLLCYFLPAIWLYIELGMPVMIPLTNEGVAMILGCFVCMGFAFLVTYLVGIIYRIIWAYITTESKVDRRK